MLFLQVQDLPWKGRESSAFPSVLNNTVADVAEETYQYDGGTISIAVKEEEHVNRVVAAINMAVGNASAYSILTREGELFTVGKTPVAPRPVMAPPPPPMAEPAPVQMVSPVPPPMPAAPVAPEQVYPAVVARTNENNPRIPKLDEIFRRMVIPDDNIERHLFSLKNSNSSSQAVELQRCLNEYRQYIEAMARILRRINELSAITTGDEAVKSVIKQMRDIASGMPNNKIEDTFMTNDYIVFQTARIKAFNSKTNKHHDLGRVLIIIPIATMMGSSTTPVQFQPLDYVLKSSPRSTNSLIPHVSGDGNYCYGNATEAFIEAVAKRDLVCLVDVAIRFLENPNMGDPMGVLAAYWPVLEA